MIRTQITVKGWLHTKELCVNKDPSALTEIFERNQEDKDWHVWSVLAPYRSYKNMRGFVNTLIHNQMWHLQVGEAERAYRAV